MGPLWVIFGTALIVAAFLYVRSHYFRASWTEDHVREIVKRFQVQSVPTVIVLNSQDEMLGRFGYKEGGPPVWIAELGVFKP